MNIFFHDQRIIFSEIKGFYKKSEREIVNNENVYMKIKIMKKMLLYLVIERT